MSTGEFWSWPFVKIMPFEPLIRAASSEEQFALHQSLDYLRKKGSGNINKKMKMAKVPDATEWISATSGETKSDFDPWRANGYNTPRIVAESPQIDVAGSVRTLEKCSVEIIRKGQPSGFLDIRTRTS